MAYWKILLNEKWKELLQKSNRAKFVHSGGKVDIPSYFQFLVKTKPYFPATDGKCYPTPAVYSASLSGLVAGWSPVSALELSPQQEKYLGIQPELSVGDCFSILSEIAISPEALDKARITKLYQYMLEQRFQTEEIEASASFDKDFKLLAVNNTFQPASQLLYLNVPRFAEKSDSPHFIFLDLPDEDAIGFCRLLGLQTVELEDLELASAPFTGEIKSNEFPLDWRSKLPYIAAVSATKKGKPYTEEYGRLDAISDAITFKPCSSLQLTWQKDGNPIYRRDVQAWQSGNDIFYLHDWQDVRTLYDLQEVLAVCFGIEGCERELGLLLSIAAEQIPSWLSEQGFAMPETAEPPKTEPQVQLPPAITPVVKTTPQAAAPTKPTTIKPFVKTAQPAQSVISLEDAETIGRWGEEYVKEKEIIEHYYRSLGIAFAPVEWVNGQGESGSPFDFRVTFEDGSMDYWEVKSTPSPSKAEYPISGHEFRHALENEGHYFIIRILAAGTANPDCKILEEPVQLIREGIIRVGDMKMVLER